MERKNNYRILGIQIILEQKERLSLHRVRRRRRPVQRGQSPAGGRLRAACAGPGRVRRGARPLQ